MFSSLKPLLAGASLLALFPLSAVAAPPGEDAWCGTNDGLNQAAIARHRFNRERIEAERARAAAVPGFTHAAVGPTVTREGDVAVVVDDGTILLEPNPFDLTNRGVRFIRKKKFIKVKKLGGSVSASLGEKLPLDDDDAIEVDFPAGFSFKFFGDTYDSVWVHSDGNLTFEDPDAGSTSRDLGRMLNGPPRIAPFFADFDPSAASGDAGVYFRFSGKKLFVTWWNVPEWGERNMSTVQVVLYTKGNVDVRFGLVDAQAGVLGMTPGRGGPAELLDLSSGKAVKVKNAAIAENFGLEETIDEAQVARSVIGTFGDVFDEIVLFYDFFQVLLGGGAVAYHFTIMNDVSGIGYRNPASPGAQTFDFSGSYGSRGKLGGFANMGFINQYSEDPDRLRDTLTDIQVVLHEVGHRWMARVRHIGSGGRVSTDLLDQAGHWSFNHDSDASIMEGNEIRDNGDGSFTTLVRDSEFSRLDLYMMGMIPAKDVRDFFYVANGVDPAMQPEYNFTFRGQRADVSIDDVIAAEGPRIPSSKDAQKEFRVAVVLLSRNGSAPSADRVAKVDKYRKRLEEDFRKLTGREGRIVTSLD